MKRSLSILVVVSMLVMLAGTALAANVTVTGTSGNQTAVVNGATINVTSASQVNTLTGAQLAAMPVLTKYTSVAYNDGAIAFAPDTTTGQFLTNFPQANVSEADLARIATTYSPLVVTGPVTAAQASTASAAITSSTAWAGKFNTAGFQNLFTPAPRPMNATTNGGYALTAYPFPGAVMGNRTIDQVTVQKFVPQIGAAAPRVEAYTKRTTFATITGTTDGELWFTSDAAGTSVLASSTTFASGTSYYMWTLLKDDGKFDLSVGDTQPFILDPPTVSPAVASGGDDDSSGCVYNPAAGLSLEWLLLIAPALGALVARIRRK